MGEVSLLMGRNSDQLPARDVVRIDGQTRFEIDRELARFALGLTPEKGTTTKLWALIGAERQLQILPPRSPLVRAREALEKEFDSKSAGWETANDEKTALVRKLMGLLRISCASEEKRSKLRFTIEADAKKLGLIDPRTEAIVFSAGGVLELWRKEDWTRICSVSDLREMEKQVRSEFELG